MSSVAAMQFFKNLRSYGTGVSSSSSGRRSEPAAASVVPDAAKPRVPRPTTLYDAVQMRKAARARLDATHTAKHLKAAEAAKALRERLRGTASAKASTVTSTSASVPVRSLARDARSCAVVSGEQEPVLSAAPALQAPSPPAAVELIAGAALAVSSTSPRENLWQAHCRRVLEASAVPIRIPSRYVPAPVSAPAPAPVPVPVPVSVSVYTCAEIGHC